MDRKLTICFYNHTGKVSGAEKVLFAILSGLDRQGHKATVFAPRSEAFESFCSANHVAYRPISALEARYTWDPRQLYRYCRSFVHLIRELRRGLAYERPDLIHANTARSGIVASLATIGMNVRVLWHVHDIMPRHPLSTIIRGLVVCSGRNRMIAVSQATADCFVGRTPKWLQSRAPMVVVHNGIDTQRFAYTREGASSFLKDIGLTEEHFRIGIVGQITPRKGHLELIRNLVPLFLSRMPHARLLVVGSALFNNDALYLEKLKAEVACLGLERHVLFLGPRDVPTVMRALNVLVLNSSNEPFGLVLAEAMATGTPVVAAAVDGVPEIVEHGVSGFLFAPGDWKALLSHLVSIASDRTLVEGLAHAGRARVALLFDQSRFRSRFFALYQTLT
jgi:L-malate glycosyltransferase